MLFNVILAIDNDWFFTNVSEYSNFSSIGIGPGIGKESRTQAGLRNLILKAKCPLVIDADGLNILAQSPDLLDLIPKNTILTPHVGEFHRLFGESADGFQHLMKAIDIAQSKSIYIILKGAHTQVVCPSGEVFFNSTGNPGMATAGSGDVLTGIIASFLSQGHHPKEASILAVYSHGLAGDMAAQALGQDSLIASDIIDFFGQAITCIKRCSNP